MRRFRGFPQLEVKRATYFPDRISAPDPEQPNAPLVLGKVLRYGPRVDEAAAARMALAA